MQSVRPATVPGAVPLQSTIALLAPPNPAMPPNQLKDQRLIIQSLITEHRELPPNRRTSTQDRQDAISDRYSAPKIDIPRRIFRRTAPKIDRTAPNVCQTAPQIDIPRLRSIFHTLVSGGLHLRSIRLHLRSIFHTSAQYSAPKIAIPRPRSIGPHPRSIFHASDRSDRTQDRYSTPQIG